MTIKSNRLLLGLLACSVVGIVGAGSLSRAADPPTKGQPASQPSSRPTTRSPVPTTPSREKSPAPERNESKPDGAPSKPESNPGAEFGDEPRKESTQPGRDARAAAPFGDEAAATSPDVALKLLKDGNDRWAGGQVTDPNIDASRRARTAQEGQKPFAAVLTCADSRLPVERLFDRGVGDIFVVRVAGNVMSPDIAGSLEYGTEHLHVPLIVVMGHTRCGAVAAAVGNAPVEGNISVLIDKIAPAVQRARQQNPGADAADLQSAAIKENVWQGVFDLIRTSHEVRRALQGGKLKIVGAVCDVATGKVEWIGEHPWQDALVEAFEARSSKATATTSAETER